MSVINILDKDVYNKIAAGEVVEKPASVVKELVENSIDAGATNISIDILDGGISQIKISDNGSGIEYDDFDKVFMPHATSKVKTADDLFKISTLGFRGEALSSISSVSKVTLSSKKEECEVGYQMKITGGEQSEIVPIGATTGTYIIVEDLFYNIPARKKFLRKPKLEENDITNYVSRLILANPHISIKYTADNKIIYQSHGTGLYDAIYSIYGKTIVDNIFEINFTKDDFSFHGYLGKPTFSKPNRTYQTLIINGRYVINQTISTAVYKAFENFIMKGTFPFFVMNLNIPLEKIDVNVHPNKLDVKFEDSNQVFGIVYSSIIDILYNINNTKNITEDIKEDIPLVDFNKLNKIDSGSEYKITNLNTTTNNEKIETVDLNNKIDNYESNILNEDTSKILTNISTNVNYVNNANGIFEIKVSDSIKNFNNENPKIDPINNVNNIEQKNIKDELVAEKLISDDENYKIIGVLFNTYILIEVNNKVLIIDQHAAHERLLYDKYSLELQNKQVALQSLLIPYVIETNFQESSFIKENINIITDLGFEIDEFGENSFKISTVPLLFNNVNIKEIFDSILSDIDNKLTISKNNTINEYLAKSACKAAVKANDILSNSEISTLIDKINKSGQVLLCPHGRPIAIEITCKEIEKWFKRIV